MRFVHTSDIRIGKTVENGLSWDRERNDELRHTLSGILRKTKELSADMLIVSGGLFSQQPVSQVLYETDEIFKTAEGIEIVIIAGGDDALKLSSPVRSFKWTGNVHYVLSSKPEKIRFPKLQTAVYAMSASEFERSDAYELYDMQASDVENVEKIRIAVLYEPDTAKAMDAFKNSRFSYVALGGMKKRTELIKNCVYYSGEAEPFSMAETGSHGVYAGDIDLLTGKLTALQFFPVAAAGYVPLLVNVSPQMSTGEVEEVIKQEIRKRGEKNIYRIRLKGNRNPDEKMKFTGIDGYRIERIIDETVPEYDFERLFQEHSEDITGQFISEIMKNGDGLSEIEHKAMFYGIDALLETSEKGENHT